MKTLLLVMALSLLHSGCSGETRESFPKASCTPSLVLTSTSPQPHSPPTKKKTSKRRRRAGNNSPELPRARGSQLGPGLRRSAHSSEWSERIPNPEHYTSGSETVSESESVSEPEISTITQRPRNRRVRTTTGRSSIHAKNDSAPIPASVPPSQHILERAPNAPPPPPPPTLLVNMSPWHSSKPFPPKARLDVPTYPPAPPASERPASRESLMDEIRRVSGKIASGVSFKQALRQRSPTPPTPAGLPADNTSTETSTTTETTYTSMTEASSESVAPAETSDFMPNSASKSEWGDIESDPSSYQEAIQPIKGVESNLPEKALPSSNENIYEEITDIDSLMVDHSIPSETSPPPPPPPESIYLVPIFESYAKATVRNMPEKAPVQFPAGMNEARIDSRSSKMNHSVPREPPPKPASEDVPILEQPKPIPASKMMKTGSLINGMRSLLGQKNHVKTDIRY